MGKSFSVSDLLGIVAIILAIVGLIFAGLTGIVLGIIAIVLAFIGMRGFSGERKNIFCVIGLILGIICVIVGLIVVIIHAAHIPPGLAKK